MSDAAFPVRDPEAGDKLHARKNAPWVEGPYKDLEFPPYEYRAYPKALYRHLQSGRCESQTVQSEAQHSALGREWCESPTEAKVNYDIQQVDIARAAAESVFADRHMSAKAKQERDEADAEAELHLVDVPPKRSHKKLVGETG